MEKPTQLELKHLAAYLPYGLKLAKCQMNDDYEYDWSLPPRIKDLDIAFIKEAIILNDSIKPILRPLGDLDKQIPWNFKGVDFGKPVRFSDKGFFRSNTSIPYSDFKNLTNGYFNMSGQIKMFELLYAHHFDVFGLIDAGLAVDVNTLASC